MPISFLKGCGCVFRCENENTIGMFVLLLHTGTCLSRLFLDVFSGNQHSWIISWTTLHTQNVLDH